MENSSAITATEVKNTSTPTGVEAEHTPTATGTGAQNTIAGTDTGMDFTWICSTSQLCALSLERPSTWKGPVEEVLGGTTQDRQIRITIGSDTVEPWNMELNPYPYGAYVIAITYLENASQTPLGDLTERHNEIAVRASLNLVLNGQSTIVRKLQYTPIDSITGGDFRGLEFIAATPPYTQASVGFMHHAVLVNSQDQSLIITGNVPNPGPKTMETWVETFRAVDERHQDIFRHVVASIRVGS